jgi:hypothetical protein
VDLIIDFQQEKDDKPNADLLFSPCYKKQDACSGYHHILDLRGFRRLKTVTLKQRTGIVPFKHVGEDPESTNRMQHALPNCNKNLLQVKFLWVTTQLRTALHQDETKHVEEWVRERNTTKKKLIFRVRNGREENETANH